MFTDLTVIGYLCLHPVLIQSDFGKIRQILNDRVGDILSWVEYFNQLLELLPFHHLTTSVMYIPPFALLFIWSVSQ